MGTALVAASAALAGVLVGKLLDRRAEERRWHRELRARVYEDFLDCAWRNASRRIAAIRDLQGTAAAHGDLIAKAANVRVFGSDAVVGAATPVVDVLGDIGQTIPGVTGETFDEWERDTWRPFLERFSVAVTEVERVMRAEAQW